MSAECILCSHVHPFSKCLTASVAVVATGAAATRNRCSVRSE